MNNIPDQQQPQQPLQQPLQQQPPRGPGGNALTAEETRVLLKCNNDAFWQRSVPLMAGMGTAAHLLVKMGYLRPHPTRGSLMKVMLASGMGWFIGKASFRNVCQQRILTEIPDSRLAAQVRANMSGRQAPHQQMRPFQGLQTVEQGEQPIVVPPPRREEVDSYSNVRQDSSDESPQSGGGTTYDELRKRHHQQAYSLHHQQQQQQQQYSRPSAPLPQPQPPQPLRPGTVDPNIRGKRVNKYGDVIEE